MQRWCIAYSIHFWLGVLFVWNMLENFLSVSLHRTWIHLRCMAELLYHVVTNCSFTSGVLEKAWCKFLFCSIHPCLITIVLFEIAWTTCTEVLDIYPKRHRESGTFDSKHEPYNLSIFFNKNKSWVWQSQISRGRMTLMPSNMFTKKQGEPHPHSAAVIFQIALFLRFSSPLSVRHNGIMHPACAICLCHVFASCSQNSCSWRILLRIWFK